MYPTKEEIEDEINRCGPGLAFTATIRQWKKEHYTNKWSTMPTMSKIIALEVLVEELYKKKYSLAPTENRLKIMWTNEWTYEPAKSTITGDIRTPSIISLLHEFGHYIHGESELKACAFSINLFKLCFKEAFDHLKWDGHMLRKINN